MIIYQSKKIPVETISHGFFGRQGGVSEGVYNSLNCALGSDDQIEHVMQNRKRVCDMIGCNALNNAYQIHSPNAVYIDENHDPESRPEVDALVTDVPQKALAILTADCAPVCFYGIKENGEAVIGIAHAGWKGALGGVLDSTMRLMAEKGALSKTIRAVIGPTIGQKSYEVGSDFYETFLGRDQESIDFFKDGKGDKKYFDLPGYCAYRLRRLGVDQIELSDIDTYKNEALCFSYRRSTHREDPDYARQISVIMIKSQN